METNNFGSIQQLNDYLVEIGAEGTIYFENPDFLDAIIGIDDDNRLVYSYAIMIQCLEEEGMTEDEAIEFISYNTIRALPYMGEKRPIIVYEFLE